jgi:hypothetical protein
LQSLVLKIDVTAFVATVLLGMAGLDTFDGNAEAKPPNGPLIQVEKTIG